MRTSIIKPSLFTLHASLASLLLGALLLCGLAPDLQAATATNVQTDGTTAYWTNNAAWNGASYPGAVAGESAYMTTNMAGSYTTILDASLSTFILPSLNNLSLSNVSGTALLIVTNSYLYCLTNNLGTGGRLQVENAATPYVASFRLHGLDPTIILNNGASLSSGGQTWLAGISGTTALVVRATPGGAGSVWNMGGILSIGSGASLQNVVTFDGGGEVGGLAVNGPTEINLSKVATSNSNKVNLVNGVRVANSGPAYVGYTNNVGNVLTVDNSQLTSAEIVIGLGGGLLSPDVGNTMVVTNGSSVSVAGNGTRGVSVGCSGSTTWGGSNNTLLVTGTNSAGSRSTITCNGSVTPLHVGVSANAVGNRFRVDHGIITNAGAILIGSSAGANANQLILTNGGKLYTAGASVMGNIGSSNTILVSGVGSLWDLNNSTFSIAGAGAGKHNDMTIDGGGVSGGAVVTNAGNLTVGVALGSDSNRLNIIRGGRLYIPSGYVSIGYDAGAASNQLVVDDGMILGTGFITVGIGANSAAGGWHSALITNGASVRMGAFYIGQSFAANTSSNNWVTVAGTNGSGDWATLSLSGGTLAMGNIVRSGMNTLTLGNGGIIPDAGAVKIGLSTTSGNVFRIVGGVMTNVSLTVATNNTVVFTAGTLAMGSATYDDGTLFNVGDGTNSATLVALNASGTIDCYGGMRINSNATLRGSGTIKARAPGAVALAITNGAILAPGLTGSALLAVSTNMVWSGGGEFQCDITDVAGGVGVGWDSLSAVGSLTLADVTPKLRITLNSLGANTANFDPTRNYSLKLVACTSVVNFAASDFQISTNNFLPVSAGTWSVNTFEGSLYLVYTASGSAAPTPNYTWTVPNNGFWSTAANWAEGAPAAGGDAAWTLTFGGNATPYVSTNNLTGTFQLSNMVFNSTSVAATNVIMGSNIQFSSTGGGIQQWGSGTFRVSNNIALAANTTFSGPGLGAVILQTNITGSGGLTKLDAGKLVLQGSNTFSGPVLVNGNGTLQADNRKALGLNSVTVSNGTLWVNAAGTALELGQPGYNGLTGLVTGSGSLWTNNAVFTLGTNSSFNTLTIANTGRMFNAAAVSYVGNNGPSNTAVVKDGGLWSLGATLLTVGQGLATGNVLRVEGSGSVLTNAPLTIGGSGGQFNRLVLTNSGSVYGSTAASSIGSSASNNTALVSGGGFWNVGGMTFTIGALGATGNVLRVDDGGVVTNIHTMYVGTGGQLNSLLITNGGKVFTSVNGQASHIGYGSSNNFTIVEGSNSVGPATLFLFGSGLYVGNGTGGGAATRDNWLRVGAGGYVETTVYGLRVGYNAAGGNFVTVTNGGLLKTVGGVISTFIGYASSNNYLIVSGANGTQPSTWNGGANPLEIGTGLAGTSGGSGNWMRVESGGLATNHSTVTVGSTAKSENNTLTITNGGQFYSTSAGAIGALSASNNSIVVAGADAGGQKALWYANGANITVGSGTGTGNVLRVGNGGVFSNAVFLFATPTPNNSVVVESGGKAYAGMVVGSAASFITNPAITVSGVSVSEPGSEEWNGSGKALTVGSAAGANSNSLTVNGRTFTNFGAVTLGGAWNTLMVTNGGQLFSTAFTVSSASYRNSMLLYGPGALWNLGNSALSISVAFSTPCSTNLMIIDGGGVNGGAVVTNVTTLTLGGLGDQNSVVITNGGQLFTSGGPGLFYGTSVGNSLKIYGGNATSVWDAAGQAVASGAYGFSGSAIGNGILIDGLGVAGSAVLTNMGAITLGGRGNASLASENYLIVTNGGQLFCGAITIGYQQNTYFAGSNNLYAIDGGSAGSVVSNGAIAIGNGVAGYSIRGDNRMTVANADLRSGALTIGLVMSNNTVSVFSNTTWNMQAGGIALGSGIAVSNLMTIDKGMVTNVGAITVGSLAGANFNNLTVTNGGKLYSAGAVNMAATATQLSNSVLVTGSGSLWDLGNGSFTIGIAAGTSTGNVLTIEQGGTVDRIGTLAINSNNAVLLNGGTLGLTTVIVGQGSVFQVGDGTQAATLKALAGGFCSFTNGLLVNNRATLMGVGTVAGGVSGVVLTNGAVLSGGLNGVGSLTLSNTTWYGGATNLVEISSVNGVAGAGYDLVNINTQLTLTANGGKFVVKMDSLSGTANFQTGRDYLLKFMTCVTSPAAFNLGDFEVDATAFVPGGTWWVTNIGYSLYLATTGSTPVSSSYVWNPDKTGNWDNVANWVGGVSAPPSGGHATNVLEFGGSGVQAYTATNNLANDHLLSNLLLTSTSTGTNILAGQQLKFAGPGSGILLQGSGWTISSNRMNWTEPLLLGGSGLGGGMILASNLVGTGAVTVTSYGTYVMGNSNAFDGPVTVNCGAEGKLRVDHAWGLGKTNSVTVSNGTLLVTAAAFRFGDAGQSGRRGWVAGSGSLWTNKTAFYVGGAAGASNNNLTVTDQGTLRAGSLFVGDGSPGYNTLIVSNKGQVVAGSSSIGTSGTNNTVVVTGTGTVYNSGTFALAGTGNVIWVENGGMVTNCQFAMAAASVGNRIVLTNGASMVNNTLYSILTIDGATGGTMVVTGPGSSLTTVGTGLIVGSAGRNSELRIENGGLVNMAVQLGYTTSYENRMVVDRATWTGGGLIIGAGSEVIDAAAYVGGWLGSRSNQVVVTNGGAMIAASAGIVQVGGYYSQGSYGHFCGSATNNSLSIYSNSVFSWSGSAGTIRIGGWGLCYNNELLVQGGSVTNIAELLVGYGFSNVLNHAIVTNNGLMTLNGANGARIGTGFASSSNYVGLYDGGLLDAKSYPISVGYGSYTRDNNLIVGIGGLATNVGTLTIGNSTASNNQLRLIGGTLSVSNLVCSNVNNTIAFSVGTLNLRGAFISNAVPMVVGDGSQSAILSLGPAGRTNIFAHGLTITNKATLTGVGGITGNTTVYGTNSPGTEGIGVITNSGNVTLAASSVSRFEIGANTTAGSGWDHLVVTGGGTLTLGGTLKPILTGGFSPTNTLSFVIMTNTTASVSGSFANEASGKVNVYTNDSVTSLAGTFNVVVSNSQYVVLTNFKPPLASGTVFKFR